VKLARDRTSHNAGSDLRRTLFNSPSCSEDMAGPQRSSRFKKGITAVLKGHRYPAPNDEAAN
jgi:hypothetical protein